VGPDLVSRAFGSLTGGERAFSLRQPVVLDPELFRLFVTTHMRLEEHPSRLVSDALLTRLLEEMLQRTASLRRREGFGREEHRAIRRSREYLAQHYSDTISLEDLSKVANLSPYHLHRVFTREMGLSPHAFQTQVRLARAKTLLHQGRPLRTVAAETGFADQSHFTREFKRYVGLTPGAFRSDRVRPAPARALSEVAS
jgi:AraC-like DNA-binding protein